MPDECVCRGVRLRKCKGWRLDGWGCVQCGRVAMQPYTRNLEYSATKGQIRGYCGAVSLPRQAGTKVVLVRLVAVEPESKVGYSEQCYSQPGR